MLLEDVRISPVHFFDLELRCPRSLTSLPDLSSLCEERAWADVAFGWNEGGIELQIKSKHSLEGSRFPDYHLGDAFELFVNTRPDNRSAGRATRHCHWFVFLPQAVGEVRAAELTRLRAQDKRPLCDAGQLLVVTTERAESYEMHVTIPASCLTSYEPSLAPRLGLNYCLYRKGAMQSFCISSETYAQPHQQPALWATLHLCS